MSGATTPTGFLPLASSYTSQYEQLESRLAGLTNRLDNSTKNLESMHEEASRFDASTKNIGSRHEELASRLAAVTKNFESAHKNITNRINTREQKRDPSEQILTRALNAIKTMASQAKKVVEGSATPPETQAILEDLLTDIMLVADVGMEPGDHEKTGAISSPQQPVSLLG